MKETVKPVDLEAIRKNTADYCANYVVMSPGLKQALNIDIPALCDEVEAMRERVREMEKHRQQDIIEAYTKGWFEGVAGSPCKATECWNEMESIHEPTKGD
jgi:hypothetical protein